MKKLARDEGSVYVLEAIILSLILLGAAYSVTTIRTSSVDNDRPRAHLERVARDSMVILGGLKDANGSLLDAYLLEAYHCFADATPSPTSCEGKRSANLSLKIESYLPPGTGYAVSLDNGVKARDIYRSVLPPGETVSASHTFTPTWNLTFLLSELSCYESGMDANFTALPLRRGGLGTLTSLALEAPGGARTEDASPVAGKGFWNVTFPAATRPASGALFADATGKGGDYHGAVTVSSCDLGGLGPTLVSKLRTGSLRADPPVAPLGSAVTITADFTDVLDIADVTILGGNVTVYEPLPGRGLEANTYVPAALIDYGMATQGTWTWTVPPDALYGVHPVVFRARLGTPTGEVEVRLVDVVTVALPDGTVPIDPPYRFVLQVWLSDWR